jgi:glycosyltransferase involved in cell wall biosynthesis
MKDTNGIRVMQVILTLERAGAQEVVRTLAEHLQEQGCAVTVCAFQDGPVRAEIEALGIPVDILDRPKYSVVYLPLFLAELVRIRRELSRLVEKYRVNVIQTHILQVLDFLVLTLRSAVEPRIVLWTMQNVEFFPKKDPTRRQRLYGIKKLGYRLIYRVLSRWVDGFVAVSSQVRKTIVEQVGPVDEKVFTVCNAVDPRPFERAVDKAVVCEQLGLPTDVDLIAVVGRLTEQKGHCYLVEAMPFILDAFPKTHLLFVGDGELRGKLEAQVTAAGLAEHIHFLGVRSDVPDLLAAADLFVQPSLWEGLSVALLEAMAAAKPIVATAVSGTTQAMVPGKTGLVVPSGDHRALAGAIVQLLSHPTQGQAMGQAAKQHVLKHYGAQKQAQDHLSLYHRLLKKRAAGI